MGEMETVCEGEVESEALAQCVGVMVALRQSVAVGLAL